MKFSINRKRNLFKVQFTSVLNDFFHGFALGKQLSTLVDFELKHRTFSIWPCFSNCFNMTCWQIEFHFQLRIIFDFCSTFTEKKRTIVFLQFFFCCCLLMLTHPTKVINTCCALNWQKREIFIK